MVNNQLKHHGIKGMRWGVRRFQNKDGSLTSAGKKRYEDDDPNVSSGKKRFSYKEKLAEKKKQKIIDIENKTAEEIALAKDRVLKSRSASELYKNAHLFNDEELNLAYKRLDLEKNIKNLIPYEVNKGKEFVDNTSKWAKSIADLTKNSTDAYNNIARIYNSIPELNNGTKWPVVDNSHNKDDKDKK